MVEFSFTSDSRRLLAEKSRVSFLFKVQASDAKHPRIDSEREAASKVGSFSCAVCLSLGHRIIHVESLSARSLSVSHVFVEELCVSTLESLFTEQGARVN